MKNERGGNNLELLAVLKATTTARTDLELATFSPREIDWAIESGLGPLLWRCTAEDPDRGTNARFAALQSADLTARVLSGETLDAANEILAACDGRGPLIGLLKGISLCDRYYPEPHLRPMGDIDLLVAREAVATVETTLETLGYRRKSRYPAGFYANHHHTCPFFRPATRDWVEVHTALIPPHSPLATDPVFSAQSVASELRVSEFHHHRVHRLSPELELVYLAAHWGFELEIVGAMVAMADVSLLLAQTPDLDWEKILGWLEGSATAAHVFLLLSFLERHGLVMLDEKLLATLQRIQRPLGRLNNRLAHGLLERYVVRGQTPGALITERNFDVIWNTLLLPDSPVRNLLRLPWRLMPDRFRPASATRLPN